MENNKNATIGVWPTVLVGMAERFAFWGLRSILVLFLISDANSINPGLGWDRELAFSFNGNFLSIFALSIVAAGVVIDFLLSVKRALLFGSVAFAAGLLLLAVAAVSRELDLLLYVGLGLAVVGSSLIRPAIYLAFGDNSIGNESRLASILYGYQWLAISVAAILAPLIVVTLSDSKGWYAGLFICSAVVLAAGVLVSRVKILSTLADTNTEKAMPIWLVAFVPVLLYWVVQFSSKLLDDRADAFFLTTDTVSWGGIEVSVRIFQTVVLVLGSLFSLIPLFAFRRRSHNKLPMMELLVAGVSLYIVSALIVAYAERAELKFDYSVLLATFLTLVAELLLFVPLLAKIAAATNYRYRATAVSLVLSFPIFLSNWLWPKIGEASSGISWSLLFFGFVTALVVGVVFYRKERV